jgi:hypothetical protein
MLNFLIGMYLEYNHAQTLKMDIKVTENIKLV